MRNLPNVSVSGKHSPRVCVFHTCSRFGSGQNTRNQTWSLEGLASVSAESDSSRQSIVQNSSGSVSSSSSSTQSATTGLDNTPTTNTGLPASERVAASGFEDLTTVDDTTDDEDAEYVVPTPTTKLPTAMHPPVVPSSSTRPLDHSSSSNTGVPASSTAPSSNVASTSSMMNTSDQPSILTQDSVSSPTTDTGLPACLRQWVPGTPKPDVSIAVSDWQLSVRQPTNDITF